VNEPDLTIRLNEDFWDCNCETDYIRPIEQCQCLKCGAEEINCPNSRQTEIDSIGIK
jgi:hypothetical protein